MFLALCLRLPPNDVLKQLRFSQPSNYNITNIATRVGLSSAKVDVGGHMTSPLQVKIALMLCLFLQVIKMKDPTTTKVSMFLVNL